jgi:hypothetical protein
MAIIGALVWVGLALLVAFTQKERASSPYRCDSDCGCCAGGCVSGTEPAENAESGKQREGHR